MQFAETSLDNVHIYISLWNIYIYNIYIYIYIYIYINNR